MFLLNPKIFPFAISLSCFLAVAKGQTILISRTRSAADYSLNDVDGDNIPGEAGVDYPAYRSPPTDTSFRCRDHDYAGYFGDVEAGCQAYHVCFPDGRNASFLCVNGTVFHQRYFVCDWWFHFDCNSAPELYNLNLFRKIPLPVLPPVQRKPFVKPVPEPGVVGPSSNPPPVTNGRGSPDRNRNRNPDGRNELLPNPGRWNELIPNTGGSNEFLPNPGGRNELLPNPDHTRKKSPDERNPKTPRDRIKPNSRGGDYQCSCDGVKSQQSKYSSYDNR